MINIKSHPTLAQLEELSEQGIENLRKIVTPVPGSFIKHPDFSEIEVVPNVYDDFAVNSGEIPYNQYISESLPVPNGIELIHIIDFYDKSTWKYIRTIDNNNVSWFHVTSHTLRYNGDSLNSTNKHKERIDALWEAAKYCLNNLNLE